MKDVLDIHRALLEHETHHEIVRLRRSVQTADEIPEVLDVPHRRCLAVRMYETSRRLIAAIVRAGQVPPPLAVNAAAHVRDSRPAPPHLVNRVTDYAAELVAPLLLPERVRVFIDRGLLDPANLGTVIYTATGDSGTALAIRASDLVAVSGATPADLATRDIELPHVPGAVRPSTPQLDVFAPRYARG